MKYQRFGAFRFPENRRMVTPVVTNHTFLTDDEINRIKQYAPQAIAEVPELVVMRPDGDSSDQTRVIGQIVCPVVRSFGL